MSGDYGNDFITIEDDEGNEFELEHLDTLEKDGNIYMAFLPTDKDETDDDYGVIILKVNTEGEDEILTTLDDDDELDLIFELFMQRLSDEEDEE